MIQETTDPRSFADLPLSPAYPRWAKPAPSDAPTKHRKTYTFLRSIMASWDRVVAAATGAAYCHGALTAPDDALDELGNTYGGLPRALLEPNDNYRQYLRAPLSRWYRFGTRLGLLGELAHLGYPNAQIVTWRDLVDAGAGSESVVFGGNTNFFYVAIFQPNGFDGNANRPRWERTRSRWLTSRVRWGGGARFGNPIALIRYIIQLVKPAHTSCRHFVMFLDTISGLNAQLLPTGNYVVIPCNEPWERVRPTYAFNQYYIRTPLSPT